MRAGALAVRALRLTLLALLGAAVPLGVYWGFVRPDRARVIATAERRLEARQKETRVLGEIAERYPEFERERQALQARLSELAPVVPRGRELAPLFERLRALAADEGLGEVVLDDMAPERDAQGLPVRLRVEGRPEQLLALVGRLDQVVRLITLERVELERVAAERYQLTLRLVAFREQAGP